MFSSQFSIHKRKKISESVNKHYILAKKIILIAVKKIAFLYASLIAWRGARHWTKKIYYMLGTSRRQRRTM